MTKGRFVLAILAIVFISVAFYVLVGGIGKIATREYPNTKPIPTLIKPKILTQEQPTKESEAINKEKDELFQRCAYCLVLKDWQTPNDKPGRGHNIAAIMVKDGHIISGARNCNFKTHNTTQHAEVRTILNYLKNSGAENLKGCTIYTTLEPCVMCAGMMTQAQLDRVVYGQTDPDYGKALERIQLDSHTLPNGFLPYPRPVKVEKSQYYICDKLDQLYHFKQKNQSLTEWLRTNDVKNIYEEVYANFFGINSPKVQYKDNTATLVEVTRYIRNFKDE